MWQGLLEDYVDGQFKDNCRLTGSLGLMPRVTRICRRSFLKIGCKIGNPTSHAVMKNETCRIFSTTGVKS